MRADADFFCEPMKSHESKKLGNIKPAGRNRRAAKVNFVEIRSFWHVFRSFDRMWSFFILCLQAMITVAWNGDGNPTTIFDSDIFKKVLSVFLTASILKIGQAVLDVVFNWKARHFEVLPVTYAYTSKNPARIAQTIKGWFGNSSGSPSLFIVAVVAYFSPNMLAVVLFMFPLLRRYLESSDYRVVMLLMWWSQPRLYVGRGMHESTYSLFKLAQRIVRGDVLESLKNRKLISLDMGSLLAGAKFRGDFEECLKAILKEVTASSRQIVLFIDEIHTVVGAGAAGGAMDAGNLLKPMLLTTCFYNLFVCVTL